MHSSRSKQPAEWIENVWRGVCVARQSYRLESANTACLRNCDVVVTSEDALDNANGGLIFS